MLIVMRARERWLQDAARCSAGLMQRRRALQLPGVAVARISAKLRTAGDQELLHAGELASSGYLDLACCKTLASQALGKVGGAAQETQRGFLEWFSYKIDAKVNS